jgi:hypothetical protein
LIRYQCPHCQRVCESSDVLRGYAVYCLSCRQPSRVPNESTFNGEMPVAPTPVAAPTAKSGTPAPTASKPVAPAPHESAVLKPAIDSIPSQKSMGTVAPSAPLPAPPPSDKQPSLAAPQANLVAKTQPVKFTSTVDAASSRPRLLRLLLVVVIAAIVLGGGFYGWTWYGKSKAEKAKLAAKQKEESRRQTIADNFDADALHRLTAKLPKKWDVSLNPVPKLDGKAVVLSITDSSSASAKSDQDLIRELFVQGKFDELTFELPDSVWAEGMGELETVVGIRWYPETAGVFKDHKLIEATEDHMSAEQKSLPQAQRWHATVFVLELKTAKMTARKEFTGQLPTGPSTDKKPSIGPRPIDEIIQWL